MTTPALRRATPAERRCPACEAPLRLTDERCPACSSLVFAAQRRVVTLLFADLAGYTRLCADLDPEEVHLLVRPLMNGLRRVCEDLGGVVPAIEGDGFMAVFGALRSTEDDPLRAVTAAVQLQRLVADRRSAYGSELPPLRVGLNLGEVLVAPSWEQSGFSVSGDAVNVASRLCGTAEPGEVVAAAAVVALLPALAGWAEPREVHVRNRDEPVTTRRLRWSEVAATSASRQLPSATTFVGRDELLAALEADGPAVLVTGEAGVGKSRLVHEWAAARGGTALVASCPSFASAGPGEALAQLVRTLLPAVPDLLGPTAARRVRRLLGEPVDTTEVDLLEAQLSAAVELVVAAAGREPVTAVVEDVHWATAPVRRALDLLVAAAGRGLTVVLTARTEGAPDLDCPVLPVPPLPPEASRALVRSLLPGADERLAAVLEERAGGLPLFLEQCSQLLLDDGSVVVTADGARLVDDEGLRRVPTGMRLFVTGRLDLLPPAERLVVEAAAVAGDPVDPELLRHLCRRDVADDVEAVVGRGLLTWQPGPTGPVLRFRHAVVRDVAYDGQLRARRVDTHRAAAEWFSVRLPTAALAGRAAHLEAALRMSDRRGAPDCELAGEALLALVLLAHGVLHEDPSGALAALERGVALVERYDACGLDRLDLDLLLAETYEVVGRTDEAAAAAVRAGGQAERVGDLLGRARSSLVLGRALRVAAPADAAVALDEADAAFRELDDPLGLAQVQVERAVFGHFQGLRELVSSCRRAFDAAQRAGDARWSALMAQDAAMHAFVDGRHELDHWLGTAQDVMRSGDTAGASRLAFAQAAVELYSLDLDRALALTAEADGLATEAGVFQVQINAAGVAAEAAAFAFRPAAAERARASAQVLQQARPVPMLETNLCMWEAVLRTRQGRHAEAAALLARARELVDGWPADARGAFERDLRHATARIALDTGHWETARQAAGEALVLHRDLDEPFVGLRLRLLSMTAAVALRVPLPESSRLCRDARDRGAPVVDGLAARWLELDDLLRGSRPLLALHLPALPDTSEGRALEHEVAALVERDWSRLLRAAEEWEGLGQTVWPARCVLWHAELTGSEEGLAGARQRLADCGAPDGFEAQVRAQLRDVVTG